MNTRESKFIVVFSEGDCAKMIEAGYKMFKAVKADDGVADKLYLFINDKTLNIKTLHFAEDDFTYTDILTF